MMSTLAAATSFNTPFVPKERFYTKLGHIHRAFSGNRLSDHVGLLAVNDKYADEAEFGPQSADTFCTRNSLSATILSMSAEAKRQLIDVLVQNSGFPALSFTKYNIDLYGPDPNVDLFLSLLIYAYYPNICHTDSKARRKVYTLEQATALISKQSVCLPFNAYETLNISSPLFVFTEKLRTNVISCKQMSTITPFQMLLFGSRKVEAVGPNLVRMDEMITLEMPSKMAAEIVALRPCLDALVVRACMHPESLETTQPESTELIEVLKRISSELGWMPSGGEHQQASSVKNSHNERRPQSIAPLMNSGRGGGGFSGGGYRGGRDWRGGFGGTTPFGGFNSSMNCMPIGAGVGPFGGNEAMNQPIDSSPHLLMDSNDVPAPADGVLTTPLSDNKRIESAAAGYPPYAVPAGVSHQPYGYRGYGGVGGPRGGGGYRVQGVGGYDADPSGTGAGFGFRGRGYKTPYAGGGDSAQGGPSPPKRWYGGAGVGGNTGAGGNAPSGYFGRGNGAPPAWGHGFSRGRRRGNASW